MNSGFITLLDEVDDGNTVPPHSLLCACCSPPPAEVRGFRSVTVDKRSRPHRSDGSGRTTPAYPRLSLSSLPHHRHHHRTAPA
jgi:hypothetical protein